MSDVFKKGGRDFLNHPGFHEDASISWRLNVGEKGYFDGGISIRDCSQDINLDLNVHSDEWYENSIYKIDTMIKHLKEVKKHLPKARKAVQDIKRKRNE